MAESFSVEAILSATDKNMTSTMKKALGACESFGDRVKSIVAGVGVTKVIGATMNVLSSSFDGAINRFDTMQSYPKVMKSLGFEVEQSQKSVAKLNQSVQGLPTSLADVVTTSKSLAAVTGNIDKATDTTIALNHAFLASGSSSEDASRGLQQYSQMLAKGTVDMQSWRTLQETMAPALTKVAKKLGIAYYDKDIIGQIAEQSGLSPKYIQENAELSPKKGMFAYAFTGRDITGKSIEDIVYEAQRKVILEIAEKESCVIIGRNADFILKSRDDVLMQ